MKITVKKGDCEISIEDQTKNLTSLIEAVEKLANQLIIIINETK